MPRREELPLSRVAQGKVSVVPLPDGLVSLRVHRPESDLVLTFSGEAAVDLAMQLMAAACGRQSG